ncbi:MAG: ATP-dependent DNA helicase [Eubacteriales bacterium]
MKFDRAANTMTLTVTELASYAFQRENPGILMKKFGFVKTVVTPDSNNYADESGMTPARHGTALHNVLESEQRAADDSGNVQTEVPLEKTTAAGDVRVSVQGYADSISFNGILHTVEEIKTVGYLDNALTPFSDPSHFAQAAIYAHLLAESAGLSEVGICLTYLRRSNGAKVTFTAVFSSGSLLRMFDALLARASDFIRITAERETLYPDEVQTMPFPYRTIREGQEQFVREAYRALTHGTNLLVSAPTGIGKTISVLYPAVKATGAGKIDRIFYLTAKNVTGLAALDTARAITRHVPHFRAVMIQAKEQTCPFRREKKQSQDMNSTNGGLRLQCRFCERVNSVSEDAGKTNVSYRERELSALAALLCSGDSIYTTERVRKTAEEFLVCPYELSLDLSEFCGMIVCDYNYVIDENVRFRRYFKDVKNRSGEKYAFLFDEAHNLPDRARATYSAVLTTQTVRGIAALCETYFLEDAEYQAASDALDEAMAELTGQCVENEYVRSDGGEETSCGFYEAGQVPDTLVRTVSEMAKLMLRSIREGTDAAEVLEDFYSELSRFVFAAGFFDGKFRFFASREGGEVTAEILCLDPSGILRAMTKIARSTILFSATLSPMDYFREVTGLQKAATLELESPYERDNLCLIAYDAISTRFSDRRGTAEDCAEVIAEAIEARCGNYLVYFPSYDYMKRVCRLFARRMPECTLVLQRPGMSYRERERFIGVFHDRADIGDEWTVGFCVLGGMFSEGIDLAGESLIGAIIVGTGMPQLSAERNIMAAYYDEKTERGRDFAYTCPGMNKVLQAAGRVIRSENDRGMVLLIDDRLGEPGMKQLFPKHWRHMRYTGDVYSMRSMLEEFWEEKN